MKVTLQCLALAVLVFTLTSLTHAQSTRTFVSGVGNDADPCSRTAPCRTFAGAIIKTFINGEIDALDPGGYGAVTITKSITIDGTQGSGFGSILSSGTTGVIVNIAAGNVNDPLRSVRLRNLSINGTGASGQVGTRTGIDGVRFLSGSSLTIENTVISDFSQDGVEVAGPAGEANQINVFLNSVVIRNCTQSGIEMAHSNASGQVVAMLNNVQVHSCATGIEGRNRTRIGIKNAAVAHCTNGLDQAGSDNIMNVDDLFVSYATNGVRSIAGSNIRLSNSVVTQNSNGLVPSGGVIHSLSGNSVFGNTVDGAFNSGPTPKS
jgi:hypothetical protein